MEFDTLTFENEERLRICLQELKVNLNLGFKSLKPSVLIKLIDTLKMHPIFSKLQEQFIKELLTRSQFVFLRTGQDLYKEEDEDQILYIPLFGSLNMWNRKRGIIGQIVVGWTIGEEALIEKNFVCRIENCVADKDCCLLSIDKN